MKRAWIFYLNSNDYYLYMLISAYKDLLNTGTKYPVYCAITKNVSAATRKTLKTIGIGLLELDTTQIDNCKFLKSQKFKDSLTWYKQAFYKLAILESNIEAQFDKIIYLDTDIQILKNIDELMDAPHMSAVPNRAPKEPIGQYKTGFCVFCSGLFVWDFMANKGLGHELLKTLNGLAPTISWHDQSVLNYWYQNWADCIELHLSPNYGLMNDIDIYNSLADKADLKIIHFTSRNRNNWPFETATSISKNWCCFKDWVENISKNCAYFSTKYSLNLPIIYYQNLKILP